MPHSGLCTWLHFLRWALWVNLSDGEAEKEKKASIESLFEDVYHEIPEHLAQQKKELDEHLAEFGSHYKLDGFDGGQ